MKKNQREKDDMAKEISKKERKKVAGGKTRVGEKISMGPYTLMVCPKCGSSYKWEGYHIGSIYMCYNCREKTAVGTEYNPNGSGPPQKPRKSY